MTATIQKLTNRIEFALKQKDFEGANLILNALKIRHINTKRIVELRAITHALTANRLTDPTAPKMIIPNYRKLLQLKREPEAARLLEMGLKQEPRNIELLRALAELQLAAKGHPEATATLNRMIEVDPSSQYAWRLYAAQAVESRDENVKAIVKRSLEQTPDNWLESYLQFLTIGELDSANDLVAQPREKPLDIWIIDSIKLRHALWRGEYEAVTAKCAQLIKREPRRPEGLFLLGASQALNEPEKAEENLLASLEMEMPKRTWYTKSTALNHLANLALNNQDPEKAIALTEKASRISRHHNPCSELLKQAARLYGVRNDKTNLRWLQAFQPFEKMIVEKRSAYENNFKLFKDLHNKIIDGLKGNRSETPTFIDKGRLTLCQTPNFPNVRRLQQKLRFLCETDVLRQFDALCQHFPHDPVPNTYKGEVLLWLGRYEASKACFRAAMSKSYDTIWSWIGLGAAYGLEGDFKRAHDIFQQGIRRTHFEGPTVFVYRGEFYRKMKQFEAARIDLNRAVSDKPQRLSAWINRALLDAELGHMASAMALSQSIQITAPSLWVDAAKADGQCPITPVNIAGVLEQMLTLMHGNRSSQIIFYTSPCGELRFVRWSAEDGPKDTLMSWGLA